jgi:hypothetical protein
MNRPRTLREVAEQADSLDAFGRYFQDWLHTLRTFTSRPQVVQAIHDAPPRLSRAFAEGKIADAWLAASAEYLAIQAGLPVPTWTRGRVAPEPWFATGETDVHARLVALRDSPAPFKSRNLYTSAVDLPLKLVAGRPAKSATELRRANAERQRRFRERRRLEFEVLRKPSPGRPPGRPAG